MLINEIKTLGALKASGYKSRSIKQEMRDNLILLLKENKNPFAEIHGYEDTVIPQLQTALLSKHHLLLLGLRGQAKTRIARILIHLLDEYMPIIAGSEIQDDPFAPLSVFGKECIETMGEDTQISWVHRSERYTEKLATPDVSVADLIGDIDPIKAATLKLNYANEKVIHYGLIPRSHRSIFVINELPDLQARIQVALFNILQEGDLQIRGFKLRLPLDIQFVFTANPEDYTNRGAIVTPLKDRIDSQIITHYPKTTSVAKAITQQEAKVDSQTKKQVTMPDIIPELIEQIAFEARQSEYVDQKSGVSARLTISAMENTYSHAELRMYVNNETTTTMRVADVYGAAPSVTGKIELVYEGELEGASNIALLLINKSIKHIFSTHFPSPERAKKSKQQNPYSHILQWFADGNTIALDHFISQKDYEKQLSSVNGLKELVVKTMGKLPLNEQFFWMEMVLHGLAEYSQLSKRSLEKSIEFKDLMSSMFDMGERAEEE